jgi:hypothetical protein
VMRFAARSATGSSVPITNPRRTIATASMPSCS